MPLEKNRKKTLTHKENRKDGKIRKGTSSQGVPQGISLSASLTVEAALVFPLFLFAMIGILFFFRVMQVTQITSGALAETGSQLALEAGISEASVGRGILYFQKELAGADCPTEYITGGKAGISWQGSTLEGEYIDLQIHYNCKLPISLFQIKSISIAQRVYMKKWTGYHQNGAENGSDIWVYITPNGTAYHLKRECTHLRLAIRTMGKEAAVEVYEPCMLCGKKESLYSYYYVTEEGDRYHTMLNCSGLKRTIYMKKLSEVGKRTPCQRCGGSK